MSLLVLVAVVTLAKLSEADDECYYKPCQKYGSRNKVCQFTIGCKLEGRFANCDVSSMRLLKPTLVQSHSKCIEPGLVPGFKDFCNDLLYNTSASAQGPAHINTDEVTTFQPEDAVRESKVIMDELCFGTTVLVSVATGCFLAGGFAVWLLFFCCRISSCPCSHTKAEVVMNVSNDSAGWNPTGRRRDIGSTSSAQLLANASMDSMSTHNTLLSEGQTSNDTTMPRPSRAATMTESGRPRFSHSRCPSVPWSETGNSLSHSSRSRSAQLLDSGRTSLSRSLAPGSPWNNAEQMSLPRSNTDSLQWIAQGQPQFANIHSQSAPWLDTIYSPESESSSRDYQSIHGGSENPYAPCSESSSDYSAPQTHRVMIIHDGEIYQPSSESSGSNNDYTSLKGQAFSRPNDNVYYATSEGSNKDYASLANETEDTAATGGTADTVNINAQRERDELGSNVKFNVNSLTFPYQGSCKSNRGWTSNLQDINEYEIVDTTKKDEEINVNNVRTLADMCDINHNTEGSLQPHVYFTLEPLQKQGE